jgi:uncharacterized delta-60 repeat protein
MRLFATVAASLAIELCSAGAAAATPGALDASFGSSGVVVDQLGASSAPLSAGGGSALQPDGKLVIAGTATDSLGHEAFMVARLNQDGSLDTSFDASGASGGIPGVVIDQLDQPPPGDTPISAAGGVAIQSDGKIVVGATVGSIAIGTPTEAAAVRLNPDGSFDSSFNGDGIFVRQYGLGGSPDSESGGVAIEPDGKIVIAGYATDTQGHLALLVSRLTPSGGVDPSFASGSGLLEQLGTCSGQQRSSAGGVAIRPDGTIDVAALANTGSGASCQLEVALIHVLGNGAIDSSFGSGGVTLDQLGVGASPMSFPLDLALQTDGKLLMAVAAHGPSGLPQFTVARFTASGAPDASFGSGGALSVQLGQGSTPNSVAEGVTLRTDGSIDVPGYASDGSGHYHLLVAQLQPNGQFDPTFGSGGVTAYQAGEGGTPSSFAQSAVIQPDGKLLLVGNATDGSGHEALLVARLLGPLPPSVAVTAPADRATYIEGQRVAASYSCQASPGATITSCDGTVVDGAPIETSTPGTHSFNRDGDRQRRRHGGTDGHLHRRRAHSPAVDQRSARVRVNLAGGQPPREAGSSSHATGRNRLLFRPQSARVGHAGVHAVAGRAARQGPVRHQRTTKAALARVPADRRPRVTVAHPPLGRQQDALPRVALAHSQARAGPLHGDAHRDQQRWPAVTAAHAYIQDRHLARGLETWKDV